MQRACKKGEKVLIFVFIVDFLFGLYEFAN